MKKKKKLLMDNLQNFTYLNPKSKYGNIVLLVPKYLNRNYLLLISSACSLQAYLHDVFSTFQASIFVQICFHSLFFGQGTGTTLLQIMSVASD